MSHVFVQWITEETGNDVRTLYNLVIFTKLSSSLVASLFREKEFVKTEPSVPITEMIPLPNRS